MKIEGYEEISNEEYNKLPNDEGAYFEDLKTDKVYYFKKVQKFPICFEDISREIKVQEGGVWIENKYTKESMHFGFEGSFPLLLKAVEKAKEVMEKRL